MKEQGPRVFEQDFKRLYREVERLFGDAACDAAAHRAFARAAGAQHEPADVWLVLFEQLWMDELRRLLVAH